MPEISAAYARQLDEQDPLKDFRNKFIIPVHNGEEQTYFLGNSLGLQPKNSKAYIGKILDQWSEHGVESFFRTDDPWMNYHDHLLKPLAVIAGALPSEITVMNQLTVNLHLMLVSFYRPEGRRNKILCEAKAFPSDQYMLETHIRSRGYDPEETIIEVHPREGEHTIRTKDILEAIDTHRNELALILWGGINYYSGQLFDMRAITEAAKKHGIMVGFDLAHAAGNVPLHLHDWNVDFACWCGYKYLNGGPGAVSGAFIHERYHKDHTLQRLGGWWGHDKESRFRMEKGFKPISSAEGWQLSTPSLLLYACLRASLDIFTDAGWDRIREKRKKLTEWTWTLIREQNKNVPDNLIECITPENDNGSQVSLLMHKNGREIFEALGRQGIMADWREPNVIRIAPVPLYNSFSEVWRFFDEVRKVKRQM